MLKIQAALNVFIYCVLISRIFFFLIPGCTVKVHPDGGAVAAVKNHWHVQWWYTVELTDLCPYGDKGNVTARQGELFL